MRPRHADVLKSMGFEGSLDDFRSALAEVKSEHFGDVTDEELIYGRNSSAEFCSLVRKKLNAPKLERVFLLRSLVALRKHGWRRQTVSS